MALLELLHKYCAWNCQNEDYGCKYIFTGTDRTEYWTHVNNCSFRKSEVSENEEENVNDTQDANRRGDFSKINESDTCNNEYKRVIVHKETTSEGAGGSLNYQVQLNKDVKSDEFNISEYRKRQVYEFNNHMHSNR